MKKIAKQMQSQRGGAILYVLMFFGVTTFMGVYIMKGMRDRAVEVSVQISREEGERVVDFFRDMARDRVARQHTLEANSEFKELLYSLDEPVDTAWTAMVAYDPSGAVVIGVQGAYMTRDFVVTTDTDPLARWEIKAAWRGVADARRAIARIEVKKISASRGAPPTELTHEYPGRMCVVASKKLHTTPHRNQNRTLTEGLLTAVVQCPETFTVINGTAVIDPSIKKSNLAVVKPDRNSVSCSLANLEGGWPEDALNSDKLAPTDTGNVNLAASVLPSQWQGKEALPLTELNRCYAFCCYDVPKS